MPRNNIQTLRTSVQPYEVLLHAAMVGQSTRFTRQDGVEETWRVFQPLLDSPPPVHPYAQGSWGPNAIHQLIAPRAWRLPFERTWRDPDKLGR